jgi:HSF-type DNA-binding
LYLWCDDRKRDHASCSTIAVFARRQWTPAGDAFVIGADLKRLEGDTLSKFFRHNRFQSLVRQLNFYAFRKINRERNMWVYKHDLFHRDRPQDLVLLRRRNGPASVDGRRRQQEDSPPVAAVARRVGDDDSTASVEAESDVSDRRETRKKRGGQVAKVESDSPTPTKRPVLLWNTNVPHTGDGGDESPTCEVDDAVVQPVQVTESEDSDDSSSLDNDGSVEQANVVSEVASQLALYARRALLESSNTRSRSRRQQGAANPLFESLRLSPFSSGSLLTYDDEAWEVDESLLVDCPERFTGIGRNDECGISPSDSAEEDDEVAEYSASVASGIVQNILHDVGGLDQDSLATAVKVSVFCMSTCVPETRFGGNLLDGINAFLLSCDKLAAEFHLYYSALYPFDERANALDVNGSGQHLVRAGDTVRVFRIFAINQMQRLVQSSNVVMGDDL